MLTAPQVLDAYYLEVRSMILEIAATLDRYDAARRRDNGQAVPPDLRLERIYESLGLLADRTAASNRAERLLGMFSDPAPDK